MPLDLYLAYLLATCLFLLIPGPTILLVVSYALGYGRRSALATVAGVAAGDFLAMTLSLAGVGALLAASATAFTILKWIGAAYLIWLGLKLWRAPVAPMEVGMAPSGGGRSARAMGLHAFAVTALNPKSIAFFVAFLPQFISPDRPALPQMAILGTTFLVLAAVTAVAYALLAGSLRARIRRPATMRLVNRIGGTALIGAGVVTAAMRRS